MSILQKDFHKCLFIFYFSMLLVSWCLALHLFGIILRENNNYFIPEWFIPEWLLSFFPHQFKLTFLYPSHSLASKYFWTCTYNIEVLLFLRVFAICYRTLALSHIFFSGHNNITYFTVNFYLYIYVLVYICVILCKDASVMSSFLQQYGL